MTPRDPFGLPRLDQLLAAIPRLLRAPTSGESLVEALEVARSGAGADAAVVFLADGDAPLRELWASPDPSLKTSLRARLKVEALDAIRKGVVHRRKEDSSADPRTRTFLLTGDSGPLGAAVLVWTGADAASDPRVERWVGAIVEMMAWSVIHRGEIARLNAQAERDKRWFKTLDDHLRVLDRERQKFAAVVNQTDTFVFVTDEARTIQWNNRAMAVLLPSDGEGSGWIGKPCREVCARLGEKIHGEDHCECPIRRALERNEVMHEELRVERNGVSGVLYLTALPIKGLEGRPHEAMVLIQDLTGLETLRQSEVRYRALFERNAEAILFVDPMSTRILLANPAAHRLLGYPPRELERLSLNDLHPAEEWIRLRAYYAASPDERNPARLESTLLTREGNQRTALVSATRVELEGRSVDLVELVDVTERRNAERALDESEARKGAMVEAALDAIISMDHAGRIVEFNPAAERIFGHQRKDVIGRDMAQLIIPAAYREVHRHGMERYLATGEERVLGRRIEVTAMRSDGSEFPVELTVGRISSNGPPVFMGFIRDITERKRAEQALRTAEQRLRAVIAVSPLVLFAIDRDGIFTLSAGRGLERLGLKEGESVGRSVFEKYRDYPRIIENMRRGLAGEEFTATVEMGETVYETHHTPVRDERGDVVGLIGVATDITDRRSLEAQLRHAQKMEAIGRLAGGVAHDFNNLLTVINGHSEVMLGRMTAGDTLRASATEIQKAGARGVLLTRQLLAFSRKNVTTLEILDLRDVVRGMEGMLHRLIGEDVSLVTRAAGEALLVRADRGQLEQVVANLAVNARDAMPRGGNLVIEIGARDLPGEAHEEPFSVPPGPYVLLTVADQGTGMSPDVLAHMFEPFFTTKAQGKGTGLGLSVVYGIVQQAGGDIRVESRLESGTTFRIVLPRVGPEAFVPATGGAHEDPGVVPPARVGRRVLLVEDESAVRALAREMLELLGYDVVDAGSGEEALEVFERDRGTIEAAVTDVVMPGMSGVELARRLSHSSPGLKVLLVSGYTKDALAGDGLVAEGFAFLQKPYTLEDLKRKLGELLEGSSVGDPKREG